jgi:two-component system phosphate regulon sensor histidine kinase PhoR
LRRGIFFRTFRGYVIIVVILSILTPLLLFRTVRSRFTDSAYTQLSRTAYALEAAFRPLLTDSSMAEMEELAERLEELMDMRVTVIDRRGVVLADSRAEPDTMENHRTRVEVIRAFRGEPGIDFRRSATLGRDMLYAAVPIRVGDSIPAVVRTSLFFADLRRTMEDVGLNILAVAGSVLVAGLLVAWILSGNITRPIRRMSEVARRVRRGDFKARSAPSGIRELDNLSTSLNEMISRTDELIDDLTTEKDRSRAILASIVEGLVVIRRGGAVMEANEAFRELACADDPVGRDYRQAVTSAEIQDFIGRALEDETDAGRLEIGPRCYAASSAPVEGTDQLVFTFRDVTAMANLARIKRDFAVNVSHELRTPLTAIKGFTETMLEGAEGSEARFLSTILRNTDRLINLVKDVQTLSEMEAPSASLDTEAVDVREVLRSLLPIFSERASEKGLELNVEFREPLPRARADAFRLEQVYINLIDNAIKYTSEGSVTVRCERRGDFIVSAVADTGPGIPPEHQARLFERFYVVDRARSRRTGGTGLGLAIVKHIVSLHGGWVKVGSSPGSGSIFTFAMPVWQDR